MFLKYILALISQVTLRQFEKCFCASPYAIAEAQAEGAPLRRRPEPFFLSLRAKRRVLPLGTPFLTKWGGTPTRAKRGVPR